MSEKKPDIVGSLENEKQFVGYGAEPHGSVMEKSIVNLG